MRASDALTRYEDTQIPTLTLLSITSKILRIGWIASIWTKNYLGNSGSVFKIGPTEYVTVWSLSYRRKLPSQKSAFLKTVWHAKRVKVNALLYMICDKGRRGTISFLLQHVSFFPSHPNVLTCIMRKKVTEKSFFTKKTPEIT